MGGGWILDKIRSGVFNVTEKQQKTPMFTLLQLCVCRLLQWLLSIWTTSSVRQKILSTTKVRIDNIPFRTEEEVCSAKQIII